MRLLIIKCGVVKHKSGSIDEENSVVKEFLTTAQDGKKYLTAHYNLDAIISIVYKVNSHCGTQFRIWATWQLKEYIIKGFHIAKLQNQMMEKLPALRYGKRRQYNLFSFRSGMKPNIFLSRKVIGGILILGVLGLGAYLTTQHKITSSTQPIASALPTPSPADQYTPAIKNFSDQVTSFYPSLGGYPPQFKSKTEEKNIRTQWQNAADNGEKLLTRLQNKNEILELHYQLGELYRMGHNLDVPDSWEKSEAHFKEILKVDPENINAKGALGTLYVNTGPQYASAAEQLFLSGLSNHPSNEQAVNLYQGLVFARVYQGNIQGALEAADAGLQIDPKDPELLQMKDIYSKRQGK